LKKGDNIKVNRYGDKEVIVTRVNRGKDGNVTTISASDKDGRFSNQYKRDDIEFNGMRK